GTNYVLRRPPPGDLPASAHDMGREYRVLSVLYRAFPPAPRAFLYCEDTSVIGRPFFVMERRRGTVVRREVPPEFGGGSDPVANRKLSRMMIPGAASPSTTGTCARWATRSPTSARSSRRGSRWGRSTRSSPPCRRGRRAS